LNRLEPGLIHHIEYGQILMGEYQRPPQPRTYDLASLMNGAGVRCTVAENLARAHWEKLVWNIPFNGLGVAAAAGYDAVLDGQLPPGRIPSSCLTTSVLLADGQWVARLRELMLEVIAAAQALGLGVPETLAEKNLERTRSMWPYKASTLLDFECGRPLELESLFLEPLRQAQKAGVPVPRLEALCRLLVQLASAGQLPRNANPINLV
jgi:2-dehydropantoate 2-reductase